MFYEYKRTILLKVKYKSYLSKHEVPDRVYIDIGLQDAV